MDKQTKVKISLVVIPIVVILLIVAVVVLIISINKMQKESPNNSNENLRKVTENTSNVSNTSNTSNTSNSTDSSNTTDKTDTSKDSDSNKSKNKKGSSGVLERANKEKSTPAAKEASARDSLTMALSAITSNYYSGDFYNKENKVTDDLTVENLEEYAPEYVYEVSWNKGRVPTATVRMQLKSDDTSPIYRAEVTEQLTLADFEEEEENE